MITGEEALLTSFKNKSKHFNARLEGKNAAGFRILENSLCPVNFMPKFRIARDNLLYTTGSCFAREIEFALDLQGIKRTNFHAFPYDCFDKSHKGLPERSEALNLKNNSWAMTPMNRYTPASMRFDLERIFKYPEIEPDTFIPISDGLVYDPQLKNLKLRDQDFASQARSILNESIKSITKADVIIITLGMTESWFDDYNQTVLPETPSPWLIKSFPNRFKFFNASLEEVLQDLVEFRQLCKINVEKDIKIIVTVSPIPLGTTFTSKDVIVANEISKTVLRLAADRFTNDYDDVDYFPSYEMVRYSSGKIWEPDMVHLSEIYVQEIVNRFLDAYGLRIN